MAKWKKRYANLRWFSLQVACNYYDLLNDYTFDYKLGYKTVSLYSKVVINNIPQLVFLISRTSKNVYKICFCNVERIKNASFKKACEVLDYVRLENRKIKNKEKFDKKERELIKNEKNKR